MITPTQAWAALNKIVGPNKEIFYLNSPIPIGNNQFQHTLYFFTVSEDTLVNITPLIAAAADLNVTDIQCLRANGLADWPTQLTNVLNQKGFDASFLTLDQAHPVVDLRLHAIWNQISTPSIYVDEYTAGKTTTVSCPPFADPNE